MLAACLVAWLMIAASATIGVMSYWRSARRHLVTPPGEGVVVLIPVKGATGLVPFLGAIAGQLGVSYRLVFAVQSADDPAAPALRTLAAEDPRVSLVVAGVASRRGQKIHNQLAALATLRPADRIVVFADADTRPPADWLAQLIRPLVLGHADLASGYRWILPDDDHLASRFCALMDWTIATAPRDRRWNICWGGSMAATRDALDRLDLPQLWSGVLLDDLVLTRAARRAGMRIHAPLRVLMPSPVRHDLRSLLDFGRRQYLLVRIHAPRHWWLAGVTLVVPALAGVVTIAAAANGSLVASAALASALILQQIRATFRARIAAAVLPEWCHLRSAALLRRDRCWLPIAHLLHLAVFLTSAVGTTLRWGGTRYRIRAPDRIEIIGPAMP